ncbi:protein kinase domain-containing protein [Legionella sp. CNM-1927-20]|uniref:protein kinase domain-containing protein n=1 Tax=Legionella sp. CNM-1927-20 TaxID=3422221 RepID=UPI00403A81C3
MVNVTIDPTKLSKKDSTILGRLLSQADNGRYFSKSNSYPVNIDGVEYRVKLKYPLYKENEKNSRVLIREIGSGGEAKAYFAETVILNAERKAIFKDDPQHQRVVKVHRSEGVLVFSNESVEDATKGAANAKSREIAEITAIYNPLHTQGSVVYEKFAGEDKDYFYNNIMHLVAGRTLADIIKEQKKLTPEMRLAISRKLLEAIKEMHDHGIIHTDIKPQNIIVDLDFQTHTVKSLKLIDLDTAEKKEKGYSRGKTEQYRNPQAINNELPEKLDLYAAAISLLQVWGVPGDKVRTPEDYDKKKQFHAQTKINDLELPEETRKALETMFEEMTHSESKELIEDSLSRLLEIELDYKKQVSRLPENIVSSIQNARIRGQEVKDYFRKSYPFLADIESLKKDIISILNGIEDNPFSTYELSSTLDSQALQQCLSIDEAKAFITCQLDLLAANKGELQASEPEHPEKEKLLKKIAKCQTLDEIVAFNAKYSDRIQDKKLYHPHDKENFKDIIFARLKEANNYQDLQKLFHSIKNNEKFLKSERGTFMKMFGEYGATKNWIDIMQRFEEKVFEVAAKELSDKMPEYKDLSTLEQLSFIRDQFRRRYLPFFSEQTGRIFQSDIVEKFNQMLEDNLKLSFQVVFDV